MQRRKKKEHLESFLERVKANKESGKAPTADITRTELKIVNKFIEPFQSYADTFINAQNGRGNSKETIKHYKQTIRKMEQFFFWLYCKREDLDYDNAPLSKEDRIFFGSQIPFAILEDTDFDAEFREYLLDVEEVSEQTVSTYGGAK